MQPDLVEAAVDDEGDALHHARFFERHQQQHQRQHIGHDDADQSDQAIGHRAADDASSRGRLPAGQLSDQARRSHGIEPRADLEYHEQHRGKYSEAADQAPLGVQEQFVQPVTPAAAFVRGAHARAGLEQGGGAVMAVRVQFFVQRPREFARGLAAQLL